MQPYPIDGHNLADMPPPFFPDEAVVAPALARTASSVAPFADGGQVKKPVLVPSVAPVPSRAIRLVRAKSGETELRLLELTDAGQVSYVVVSATLQPYSEKREPLVQQRKKTPMNHKQAMEEFDRRVKAAYPPETLRHGPVVEIHINLI